MNTPKKRKFFTSATRGQKRQSSFITESRKSKRAKRVYEFEESSDLGVADLTNDTFEDSGLAEDLSDQSIIAPAHWMPILNKNRQKTPEKTYSQQSPARTNLKIYTSTPIKPSRNRRQLSSSDSQPTMEKANLWQKAMKEDPNLRSWIEKFNEELHSIEQTELFTINETQVGQRTR